MWKKNQRKAKQLKGESYTMSTGEFANKQSVKPPCDKCILKCNENINEEK